MFDIDVRHFDKTIIQGRRDKRNNKNRLPLCGRLQCTKLIIKMDI